MSAARSHSDTHKKKHKYKLGQLKHDEASSVFGQKELMKLSKIELRKKCKKLKIKKYNQNSKLDMAQKILLKETKKKKKKQQNNMSNASATSILTDSSSTHVDDIVINLDESNKLEQIDHHEQDNKYPEKEDIVYNYNDIDVSNNGFKILKEIDIRDKHLLNGYLREQHEIFFSDKYGNNAYFNLHSIGVVVLIYSMRFIKLQIKPVPNHEEFQPFQIQIDETLTVLEIKKEINQRIPINV
eukprot:174333_1